MHVTGSLARLVWYGCPLYIGFVLIVFGAVQETTVTQAFPVAGGVLLIAPWLYVTQGRRRYWHDGTGLYAGVGCFLGSVIGTIVQYPLSVDYPSPFMMGVPLLPYAVAGGVVGVAIWLPVAWVTWDEYRIDEQPPCDRS